VPQYWLRWTCDFCTLLGTISKLAIWPFGQAVDSHFVSCVRWPWRYLGCHNWCCIGWTTGRSCDVVGYMLDMFMCLTIGASNADVRQEKLRVSPFFLVQYQVNKKSIFLHVFGQHLSYFWVFFLSLSFSLCFPAASAYQPACLRRRWSLNSWMRPCWRNWPKVTPPGEQRTESEELVVYGLHILDIFDILD
jgi:hypothetical protein